MHGFPEDAMLAATISIGRLDWPPRSAAERTMSEPGYRRISGVGYCVTSVTQRRTAYLDVFDPDADALAELKAHYRRGGLGDMVLKRRSAGILLETVAPIRERRADLSRDMDLVMDVLRSGTAKAGAATQRTRETLMEGLRLFRLR
jgi:tryptophanyl-tRNA synthetase